MLWQKFEVCMEDNCFFCGCLCSVLGPFNSYVLGWRKRIQVAGVINGLFFVNISINFLL